MCGVCGRIFHELEVVLNALVVCLRGTETLMYSSFIPVESRARSIVFQPEPATSWCMWSGMYVCIICVYDNSNRPRTDPLANQVASWARGERWHRSVPDFGHSSTVYIPEFGYR